MRLNRLAAALILGLSASLAQTWSFDQAKDDPGALLDGQQVWLWQGGQLLALRLDSGEPLWRSGENLPKAWPAAAAGGKVFWFTEGFELLCTQASDGQLLWRLQVDRLGKGGLALGTTGFVSGPVTRPVLHQGKLLFGSAGVQAGKGRTGALYAVDVESGQLAWSAESEYGVQNPPLIDGERVIVGGLGAVQAFELASGKPLWRADNRKELHWGFRQQGETLLVSAGRYGAAGGWFAGTLQALDMASGKKLWEFDIGGPSDLAVHEGVVAGVAWGMMGGNKLVGLDLASGEKRWEQKLSSSARPLQTGALLVHQDRDNQVQILEIASGKLRHSLKAAGDFEMGFTTPWARFADPFLLDGQPAVASWDRAKQQTVVQMIDAEQGRFSAEWRFEGRLTGRPQRLADGALVARVQLGNGSRRLLTVGP